MCDSAWESMSAFVMTLAHGGGDFYDGWMKDPKSAMISCNDGFRPIVREMVKTAIENQQNLIVEGCYIPFDWKKDFDGDYLEKIQYRCLIMSRRYIENHFAEIAGNANV